MDHKKNHGQEKEPQEKFEESEFINKIVKFCETFKKKSSISYLVPIILNSDRKNANSGKMDTASKVTNVRLHMMKTNPTHNSKKSRNNLKWKRKKKKAIRIEIARRNNTLPTLIMNNIKKMMTRKISL